MKLFSMKNRTELFKNLFFSSKRFFMSIKIRTLWFLNFYLKILITLCNYQLKYKYHEEMRLLRNALHIIYLCACWNNVDDDDDDDTRTILSYRVRLLEYSGLVNETLSRREFRGRVPMYAIIGFTPERKKWRATWPTRSAINYINEGRYTRIN